MGKLKARSDTVTESTVAMCSSSKRIVLTVLNQSKTGEALSSPGLKAIKREAKQLFPSVPRFYFIVQCLKLCKSVSGVGQNPKPSSDRYHGTLIIWPTKSMVFGQSSEPTKLQGTSGDVWIVQFKKGKKNPNVTKRNEVQRNFLGMDQSEND